MTDTPTAHPFRPPEPSPESALPRLLPWTTSEGKPAYLSAAGGFLSAVADDVEKVQLDSAQQVLDIAHVVLDNPEASHDELRFAGRRLRESLRDTLRVAVSRRLYARELSNSSCVVRRWPHDPRSVGPARHELRRALEAWGLGELADQAELVLSELLTNAVRHGIPAEGREIETRYKCIGAGVRIEVHDTNESRPVLQKAAADAESGRGLSLVDAVTGSRWGVSERDGVGKLVWAVVGAEGELPELAVLPSPSAGTKLLRAPRHRVPCPRPTVRRCP
ncbi:ATP-binding protein [Streptomyces sp. NBC_01476]|uniref:ATP-binding protein n=1 Tax=Streptomyces sp. NBC_01476 TaxID=2903881 RepID=UPI002E30F73C|nr:ATP-binding protein [Streptomyces sp. NBC_01476]